MLRRPQASGFSATHEEYREARETKPVLVFVHEGVELEPDQAAFAEEVRNWSGGAFTAGFQTPDDLRREVTRALHRFDVTEARTRAADPQRGLQEARELVGSEAPNWQEARLVLAIAPVAPQSVLRPTELEDERLHRDLKQAVLFGEWALFDAALGVRSRVDGDRLVLEQDHASVSLGATGSIRIALPAYSEDARRGMSAVIEEEVFAVVQRAMSFASWLLARVDPTHRVSDVVPVVALQGTGYAPWRTRAEHAASPSAMTMRNSDREVTVELSPPARRRAALEHQTRELAEDFTVLLRRQVRSER